MSEAIILPSSIIQNTRQILDWLSQSALPLWSTRGVDLESGGFIEQLTPDGELVADVRRARLVARQIYVFKSAAALGWGGSASVLVEHGLKALIGRHLDADNVVIPRYLVKDQRGEGEFDLYDQAFTLFGLAHGFAHTSDSRLEVLAAAILEKMREDRGHSWKGFVEHVPAQAPLKANPHMHMLEAALAWSEVSGNPEWSALADEIVDLCLEKFLHARTGALHEYFEVDWRVMDDPAVDIVEPGHQSEWAWLLLRWTRGKGSQAAASAAARLMGIAEQHGMSATRPGLINELDADLNPRDSRLRLWPQTERIKALIMFAEIEADAERRSSLLNRLSEATGMLLRFFDHPIRGSWWEHFDPEGSAVREPARASSLYHIMGAALELGRLTGQDLRSADLSGRD